MKKIFHVLLILPLLISCKKETYTLDYTNIPVYYGPEDILLDYSLSDVRLLASCAARRSQYGDSGEIIEINLQDNSYNRLTRTGEPVGFSLHPHGFDIVTLSGVTYLYVITHRPFNDTGNAIIRYKIDNHALKYDRIYFHGLIKSPNAIAVLPNGGFYFSNDGNESLLNILIKPTNGSLIYSDEDGNMKVVDEGLRYANGVAVRDKKVFLATVLGDAVYSYDRDENFMLTNKRKLCSGYGWDNFRWKEDKLIAARHTDIPKFLLYYTDDSNFSPFEIVEIDTATGNQKIMLKDEGSTISGVSTALVWEEKIYCGQIFEPFIVSFNKNYGN